MTARRTGIVRLIAFAALAALCCGARTARADLPGSLPLSAAGDGHLWWVVRIVPELDRVGAAIPGADGASTKPTFALMHHAANEPAPSERLVMRFATEPLAIAAEGQRVVVLARGEREGAIFAFSVFAARNEAVGHWYTLPRGAPIVLPAPPVEGVVRACALAGDALSLLVRVRRTESTDERHWLGSVSCESGAGASWTERPLPPFDWAEPVRLFARDGALAAVGVRDGAAAIAGLHDDAWRAEPLVAAVGAIEQRGVIGAFEVSKRTVVVERVAGVVRLGLLRGSTVQPWAEFAEPGVPWSVGPFGGTTAVLEIGAKARASTRAVAFSANSPGELVPLQPPGFASGSWIHLPIIAILSVALVLAAVIFGSDAYLDRRRPIVTGQPAAPGSAAPVRTRVARGATLSRRATAFLVDMLPGMVVVWFFVRGTPFDLLRIPAFQPDLAACVPALVVFGAGWLVATVGDVAFGRSMGKRIVGLRICGARGGGAGAGKRLLRALASAISVASPLVMLIALLNPWRDGPAEMLTGTAVLDEADAAAQAGAVPGSASGEGPADGSDGENRPG